MRGLLRNRFRRYKYGVHDYKTIDSGLVKVEALIPFLPEQSYRFRHEAATPPELYHYSEARDIYIIKDASVWADWSAVVQNGQLIAETMLSPFRRGQLLKGRAGKPLRVVQEAGYSACLDGGPWNNYYHWYVDTLPRLYALHHPELRRTPNIKLFTARSLQRSERDLIGALIPDNVELVQVPERTALHASHYIHLPYLSSEWAGFLPKEYLDHYRQRVFQHYKIEEPAAHTNRNIYISRRLAGSRRIKNERAVTERLEARGFTTCCLETFAHKDQVELFASAATVVGQHGAGLTNLLYAAGARVLEIFSTNYPGLFHYRLLAAALGHEYGDLHFGKLFRPDELQVPWKLRLSQSEMVNADIEVDVEQLEQKLQHMNLHDDREPAVDSVDPLPLRTQD